MEEAEAEDLVEAASVEAASAAEAADLAAVALATIITIITALDSVRISDLCFSADAITEAVDALAAFWVC